MDWWTSYPGAEADPVHFVWPATRPLGLPLHSWMVANGFPFGVQALCFSGSWSLPGMMGCQPVPRYTLLFKLLQAWHSISSSCIFSESQATTGTEWLLWFIWRQAFCAVVGLDEECRLRMFCSHWKLWFWSRWKSNSQGLPMHFTLRYFQHWGSDSVMVLVPSRSHARQPGKPCQPPVAGCPSNGIACYYRHL